jgi:hypothetical protein
MTKNAIPLGVHVKRMSPLDSPFEPTVQFTLGDWANTHALSPELSSAAEIDRWVRLARHDLDCWADIAKRRLEVASAETAAILQPPPVEASVAETETAVGLATASAVMRGLA